MRKIVGFVTMTVREIFENMAGRKTVWTKRGNEVSKREVMTVSTIRPRSKLEVVKQEPKAS